LQTDYRTPQGNIWVESIGNGATFIFTLPNYNTTEKIAMKKILIVDDEPNIVMSLNIHLRKIISSFHSTDGQEALDILEKQFQM
jgi:PleD family two-component response regulator